MFCHNSTVHSATNFQPYELVYGNKLTVPNSFTRTPEPQYNYNDYCHELKKNMQEAHQLAKAQLQTNKIESKNRYDQTLKSLNINPGDKVMMKEKQSKGKLAPKWLGPYIVIESHPDSPYLTILKKNKQVPLHRNIFKKFHERN